MTKKRIIVFILIALLLISGIVVNIIAMQGRKELDKKDNISTNIAENVDNNIENKVLNTSLADVSNIINEEDLELSGDKYNSFDVQDKDGNTVKLGLEENKPMVLLFWNNIEEVSVDALKLLQGYVEKYGEKVTFSSVAVIENSDEEKQDVEKVISENEITIPIVYDTEDGAASKANNISKIPSIVMINKKGEIINTVSDDINEDVIEANLDILVENFK